MHKHTKINDGLAESLGTAETTDLASVKAILQFGESEVHLIAEPARRPWLRDVQRPSRFYFQRYLVSTESRIELGEGFERAEDSLGRVGRRSLFYVHALEPLSSLTGLIDKDPFFEDGSARYYFKSLNYALAAFLCHAKLGLRALWRLQKEVQVVRAATWGATRE